MFNLIKNLFKNKEIFEEKINLNELNPWLDAKTRTIIENLNLNINQIINRINDEKVKAAENIKKLEDAKLQNPNIPNRAKTIMQGNRSAFIKKISFFFNNLDLKYSDPNRLIGKCKDIENEINAVGKSTARSYQILNEFFAREAENVAANLKNIENNLKEIINLIKNSKITNIDKIKKNIGDIQDKIGLKQTHLNSLNNENNDLKNKNNKKLEIENRINQIKSSSDYGNYEKLLKENENTKSKLDAIENKLFHDFSVLEKALKKYAKIAFENEKLILEYLNNPVVELIKDNEFKILRILDNLKNTIQSNKLDLDERKGSKALEKIEELDGVYFNKIKEDFKTAKERLNGLDNEIKNNQSNNELEKNNNELKIISQEIENLNNKISMLNNEVGKINIEKLKENLQTEINNLTNAKVVIP